MEPVIFVHGGAGNDYDQRVNEMRQGVILAAQAGWASLKAGQSALDAVEAAVNVLENDPNYDAGIGSFLNAIGEVEMDAIIMEGASLSCGSVAGIQRVKNPVSVARLVMERTRHCLLVGAGAEAFARAQGVAEYPMEKLAAQSSTHLLDPQFRDLGAYLPGDKPLHKGDTVGAIALDARGNLAAATSTGGIPGKLPGRVGDSPIIGCGAYCDNLLGAASATGIGEDLMKLVISKAACDLMGAGVHPQEAAERMIGRLEERLDSIGGLILLNPAGQVGSAFNTHHMVRAWISGSGVLAAMD